MFKQIRSLPILVALVLLVTAVTACSSDQSDVDADTAVQQSDPNAITVEQVLDQARIAAADIVSYKSRTTIMSRSSTSGFDEPVTEFTEHAENGNNRLGMAYPHPYNDDVFLSEYRKVGTQSFSMQSDERWEESTKPRSEPRTVLASKYFLSLLDMADIELRSTDERTEDRSEEVYRLVFSQKYEQAKRTGGYVVEVRTNALLISKESFQIVAWLQDSHGDIYTVDSASEIDSDTYSQWAEDFRITNFYDFNEPIVIEVPENYLSWDEQNPVVSAVIE
jgi:hypothetical protein